MPQNQAANDFATTLAAAISTTGATSMTLTSAAAAPSTPFYMTLTSAGASGPPFSKKEIVQVTACNTGTGVCTIVRGQQGTTAQTWSSGDNAANEFTAGDANGLVQANWPLDASWMVVGNPNGDQSNVSTSGSGVVSAGIGDLGWWLTSGTTASSTAYRVMGTSASNPTTSAWDPSVGNGYAWVGQFYIEGAPAAAGDSIIVSLADTNAPGGIGFEISYSGGLVTNLYNNGTLTSSAVAVTASAWHRFAIIASGSTTSIYIDGTLAGTVSAAPGRGNSWIVAGVYVANGTAGTNVKMDLGPSSVMQSFT